MTVPFDLTDPIAAVNAWLLTALLRHLAPEAWGRWLRPLTPILAVLLAVFVRTVFSAVSGEPLTVELLLRALAAGAIAVVAHSQFRELVKVGADKAVKEAIQDSDKKI